MRTSVLSTPRKHMTESLEESCCVLREYGVDGRLLLLAGCEKSLCSCSETCVPVVDVESQPFTVDIEFRKMCVLSPLFFIVYMNWIESHIEVDDCVTIASCGINPLIIVDDLVLLPSSEQSLQHAPDGFSSPCIPRRSD